MIELVLGDITRLKVDAIVNAANSDLIRGGGVCGAIHKAAGPELEKECLTFEGCATGKAVLTKGYNLIAGHVIHAVGPIYHRNLDTAPELLKSAYESSLLLALQNKFQSIAFPCISTGIYGYPRREAAQIAFNVVQNFLKENSMKIIFCCFDQIDYDLYDNLMLTLESHTQIIS